MPELDLVAEADNRIVGNVIYSKAKVVSKHGEETEVLTFGPLSVLPSYWHKGVGTALMRYSITEAKRKGYRAIIFYGHPDYYPRFGFRNAAAFSITSPDGKNFDALMAMPLYDGGLDGISGAFHEDEAFNVDSEAAEEYNKLFAPKEPADMIPINVLLDRLDYAAKEAFISRDVKMLALLNRFSGREMLHWDGIDNQAMEVINITLAEYGYSPKLMPSSHIIQLAEMGVRVPAISGIRSKKGVHVHKVESEGSRYILKCFDMPEDRREISNYKLLSKLGIPTLPVLNQTETAILLPDVGASADYRLGVVADLSDTQIASAVAQWYKILHCKGYDCPLDGLYDETDTITLENIGIIASKLNTQSNPFWHEIENRFAGVRQKIDLLQRTLTYNDFYWTNLIVHKNRKSAMMLDFNLLGKGYAYGDVRNVTSSMSEDAKKTFLNEYGVDRISDSEKIADAVLSPIITLYNACQHERFPSWAESSLEELHSGALLGYLCKWVG